MLTVLSGVLKLIPSLTVGICIHKPELKVYTKKTKKVCQENGYTFLLYEQYGEKNQSALVGRKRLIEMCNTDYIWLVDADDWIKPIDFPLKADIEMIYAEKSNGELLTYEDCGTPIGMPPTWLRICKTDVAKRAIQHYPDIFAIDAEDTCLSYYMEMEAKSIHVNQKPYYIYNLATSSVAGIMTPERLLGPFQYYEVYNYLPPEYKTIRDEWLLLRVCMSPHFKEILDSNMLSKVGIDWENLNLLNKYPKYANRLDKLLQENEKKGEK